VELIVEESPTVLMGHVDGSMISRVYQHLAHDPGQLGDVLKKVKPVQMASGVQSSVASVSQ
jgi:hypothetical protein